MNFDSVTYLLFLPVVVLLYWWIMPRFRWGLLLGASYIFYMCWKPKLILLFLAITGITYGMALLIDNAQTRLYKKIVLMMTIVTCIGTLVIFKYLDFLLGTSHW